jgi:multidrug efflux pump subunit AcrA (membrane-fusion protein)
MMQRKTRVIGAGLAVVALAAPAVIAGAGGFGGSAHASSNGAVTTSTVKVVRTDLTSTVQVAGSIGYDGSYSVLNPAGASAQAVQQAQNAVAQAQATLSADQTAASDSDTSSAQAIAQAQAAVNAAQTALAADQTRQATDCAGAAAASPACAQDGTKVTQDQTQLTQQQSQLSAAQSNAVKSTHQNQAKLAADNMALQNAQTNLTLAQSTATNPGTTYTALPGLGQVINQGQQLYAINGKPVPLFYGTVTLWRAFALGMDDGADVGELTQNLIALGFGGGLTQSNHFSQATVDAIKRWQASLGLPQTGAVRLGEVVFEPGPIRVSSVHGTLGGAVAPGPVLDATSTNRVVTVSLSVSQEYLVHTGDAVSVLLPDGKATASGHVRDVSSVATTPSGGNGNGGATVAVVVTLDDPASSGRLDQAPVNVNITDKSVRGVLAVPINALLALSEGGDAVKVVAPDGTGHLAAVQTGLFSNTMVEISGPGISEGTVVEVPSS